jgi:hypothetical protein
VEYNALAVPEGTSTNTTLGGAPDLAPVNSAEERMVMHSFNVPSPEPKTTTTSPGSPFSAGKLNLYIATFMLVQKLYKDLTGMVGMLSSHDLVDNLAAALEEWQNRLVEEGLEARSRRI